MTTVPEPIDSKLDTQALLSRASRAKKATTSKPAPKPRNTPIPASTTRVTRSMSVAARETEVDEDELDMDSRRMDAAQKPLFTLPCTPADQLINPATPATPPPQAPAQVSPQPATAPSQAQGHIAKEAEVGYARTLNELSTVLEKQPTFADADQRLEAFASLPPDQQQDTLEQWCVQMYKNPDFRVLCRALDATHRAQLALTL